MKRNRYIVSVVFIVCMFLGGVQHVSAQTLEPSGTWGTTTVTTQTVNLIGKVTINGQITIPNGVILTINGADKMIQRASTGFGDDKKQPYLGNLFHIQPGGRLVISNATIDGNNAWEGAGVYALPTSKGVEATGSFINLDSSGTIELTYVTLQNGWVSEAQTPTTLRSSGTAIKMTGTKSDNAAPSTLTLENCTFQKLYCTYGGSAIFVNRLAQQSTFSIANCTFTNNTVWYNVAEDFQHNDGNQGGIIRTQGSTNVNATISGGTFEKNVTNGQAGGIYWNAGMGSLIVKDNVQFIDNKAGSYGGAMMVMTKVELQSATMTGNEAMYGGGLAYRPFNSGSSAKSYTEDGKWDGTPFPQLTEASMKLTDAVEISRNTATMDGGGIFIESGNIRFATQYGDEDGENEIDDKELDNDNYVNNQFRDEPAEMVLTIDGATITSNTADNGGGIYMQSVKYGASDVDESTQSGLKLLSGTIQNNTATNNGGGVYLKGIPISFEGDGSKTVKANVANGSGGGIYIDNTVKLLNQDLAVNLKKTTISNNEAGSQGGGVYVTGSEDVVAVVNLEGITMTTNAATGNGGGLCLNGGNLNINGTGNTIQANNAQNGGGVYVTGSEDVVAVVNLEGITMTTNAATGNGGGLCLNGGNLNINGTGNTIQANNAQNGGGVCLEDGELAIEQCDITDNSATNLGGGLFVANDHHVEIELTGSGIFEKNTAIKAGGGMAMQGPITLTFSGSLQNNTAGNGGGIYLSNTEGASQKTLLDFTGGFIRDNVANGTGNIATTGYLQSVDALKGFGGGAFLDSNTELKFTLTDNLGFYGNLAESGADDIFANGSGTSVALPYVTKDETHDGMDLADFDVPVDKRFLFWVKDYVSNDTKYSQSPAGIDENNMKDGSNMRYRTAIEKGEVGYWKLEPYTYTGYISLALGYRLLFATIQKSGLAEGESAIFKIYKGKDNNGTDYQTDPYSSILLTGSKASSVSRRIALSEGWWKVEETNWSWNYTPEESEIPLQVIENQENVFAFKNNPNGDIDKTQYDEVIIPNTMNKSSTSNTGGGSTSTPAE